MDLKRLEYFITIVNEGNISAAAKTLHLSQPPLSNQIKLLENEIGCILFERGSRQIKLTEAGRILYNRATILLDLANSALEELESYKKGVYGTLRMGVVSSVGGVFLKDWILPFQKKYPDIRYEIFEANTYQLLEQLKGNSLDFAVVRTPFPVSTFKRMDLFKEPIVAIGNEKYFSTNKEKDSVTLQELANTPILLYRRWETIFINLLKEKKIEWEIFCKNDDARTTLHWANEGLGVGIAPESAKSFASPNQTIIKNISDCTIYSTVSVIFNSDTYHSLTASQFLNYISERTL